MDKPESRQTEMDARHQDAINWRNTVRAEDKDWRETLRDEDKAWRQLIRAEDLGWRQSTRDEDKAWRAQAKIDDSEHRLRMERANKRCCALTAAVQSCKPGTSPEQIFALAKTYEAWLNSEQD